MKRILLLLSLLGVALSQNCQTATCKLPECRCLKDVNPGGIEVERTPQLVMLTFDDAVNQANFPTYKDLFLKSLKNPSNCNIGATFFVSHEYNNYAHLHQLWGAGSEIAVHTITHETNIDMWKNTDAVRWTKEASGMRTLINKYAQIPLEHIKGFRAPFLQTSGNTTFEVLHKEKFTYDSSLSTRSHAGLDKDTQPIWPYTFDYKNPLDCIVRPCPTGSYPGLWEVPLVSHFKLREVIKGEPLVMMPCAMADACLPFPITEEETYLYFMENFERHYKKNRAPFPLFLHESWLREPGRKAGYVKFFNTLMDMKDVFIVPVNEVIEYIKNPQAIENYKEVRCIDTSVGTKCPESGRYCYFDNFPDGSSKVLFVCGVDCPENYPTLDQLE